jgi:diguanylate cyclase (GGDEF)-like protein
MWILKPEITITIGSANHIIRLSIFLTAIWFANLGSRIFQSKLSENAEQIGFQKITTEISTEFISVNEQNLRKKIDLALSKLGNFLNSDRIYIYMFDEDNDKNNLTCHGLWKNDNTIDNKDIDKEISISNYPRFVQRIQVGNIITLSNISDYKSTTGDELPILLGSKEKAFVAMPIITKNNVYGFFGVDSPATTKQWSDTQLDFFRIISLIFSATFERIQQEQEIIELAYFDHLTKLPNRILFRDRVSQMIRLSERTNNTLAVIFLDLDAFKSVNDTIGHDGGDTLIIKLAEQLTKTLRKSDTVARFGGDEFLIMLSNLPSTDVIPMIADKILHIFDKPFVINEQEFFVTASAGISVYPFDGKDADSLVKNADLAMYKAKELGKNRYIFCTDDMREEVLFRMRLTNNLFRALDKNELKLYYQPQINTSNEKIVGAEALLRWFHPEYGLINPGLFIPLAEQIGLIGSIGDWVLKEACRQCRQWQENELTDISIAVNVSLLQLKHPKFVSRVEQILKETKLEAKYLELELTESAAVSTSDYIIDVLHSLKDLGITISIDDFGTEYSSLSRLSSMPIDRIKLDMHFIHSIDKSEKQNAIIKSIIELSHILGLQVVAEGVETEAQLKFLRQHKSDIIQGFYFHRPIPPDEFKDLLSKN